MFNFSINVDSFICPEVDNGTWTLMKVNEFLNFLIYPHKSALDHTTPLFSTM